MDVSDDLPTLLILGDGEPMRPAIEEALGRHATFAEAAETASAVAAVTAAAPDLVVLVGDAAADAEKVIAALGANAMARSVPVAVILEGGDIAARLKAARSGVVVVERTASVDEMARKIADLARELPERTSQVGGELGEATLADVLDIVRRELETGILSVESDTGASARFVLRSGRKVDAAIRDFVGRIRPLIEAQEAPLRFDYSEDRGLDFLDAGTEEGDRQIFDARRVALIEDDAALADALAQELRAHGAQVAVLTSSGSGLDRARQLDPELVLIEEKGLDGPAYDILRLVRRDMRLRWASLLVIRGDELMPAGEAPRMDRLAGAFSPLLAPDREIVEKAHVGEPFDARLEALGPSRLLRALSSVEKTFHVTVRHPRVIVEIAISQGLIAGAEAMRMGDESSRFGGPSALAALLAVGSGRVSIELRDAPASANILLPAPDALTAAGNETPPIRPSILPTTEPKRPSTPPETLLKELESVLGRLKTSGIWSLPELMGESSEKKPEDEDLPQPPRGEHTRITQPAPAMDPGEAAGGTQQSDNPPEAQDLPEPAVEGRTTALPVTGKPVTDDLSQAAKRPMPPPPRKRPAVPKLKRSAPPVRLPAPARIPAEAKPKPLEAKPPTPAAKSAAPRAVHSPSPAAASPDADEAPKRKRRAPKKTLLGPVAVFDRQSVKPKRVSQRPSRPAAPEGGASVEPANVSAEVPASPEVAPSAEDIFDRPTPNLESEVDVEVALPIQETSPVLTAATNAVALPQTVGESTPVLPAAALDATDPLEWEPAPRRSKAAFWAAVVILLLAAAGAGAWWKFAGPGAVIAGVPPSGTDPSSLAAVNTPPDAAPEDAELVDASAALDVGSADAGAVGDTGTPDTGTPDTGTPDSGTPDTTPDSNTAEPEDEPEDDSVMPTGRAERLAWLLQSGNFFRGRGRLTLARRRYDSALRLSPRNGRALAGLTRLSIAERKGNEAVGYARRLLQVNSANAGNHVLLGDALSVAGQRVEARRSWEQALSINPRHRAARRRLGR